MSNNFLAGSIPVTLLRLGSLSEIELGNNYFTGNTIPSFSIGIILNPPPDWEYNCFKTGLQFYQCAPSSQPTRRKFFILIFLY